MGQTLQSPRRYENSETVPLNENWSSLCNFNWVNRQVAITRSNCYDCGQNRITTASSNFCVCRAGQSPGYNFVCGDCPANTYKDSPSNAACSRCVAHSTSPAGSTSVSACLCAAGRTKTGGQCVLCQGGKYKPGISDNECSACPANSYSAEGSSARTECVCNTGYIGESGGVCSVCEAGKYKSSST